MAVIPVNRAHQSQSPAENVLRVCSQIDRSNTKRAQFIDPHEDLILRHDGDPLVRFVFAHRALTARRAASLRWAAVKSFARALPPRRAIVLRSSGVRAFLRALPPRLANRRA
jgi:hypothetical protein